MKKNSLSKKLENNADRFTKWIGSISSVIFHTIFFVFCLLSPFFGFDFDRTLLFLTTLVSLEAIYLAIFIQFTVNKSKENIEKVEKNIDEIQEDIDEIQEDVDEIQGDIDEIQEDVEEIEEDENKTTKRDSETIKMISNIADALDVLQKEIEKLKIKENKKKDETKRKSN